VDHDPHAPPHGDGIPLYGSLSSYTECTVTVLFDCGELVRSVKRDYVRKAKGSKGPVRTRARSIGGERDAADYDDGVDQFLRSPGLEDRRASARASAAREQSMPRVALGRSWSAVTGQEDIAQPARIDGSDPSGGTGSSAAAGSSKDKKSGDAAASSAELQPRLGVSFSLGQEQGTSLVKTSARMTVFHALRSMANTEAGAQENGLGSELLAALQSGHKAVGQKGKGPGWEYRCTGGKSPVWRAYPPLVCAEIEGMYGSGQQQAMITVPLTHHDSQARRRGGAHEKLRGKVRSSSSGFANQRRADRMTKLLQSAPLSEAHRAGSKRHTDRSRGGAGVEDSLAMCFDFEQMVALNRHGTALPTRRVGAAPTSRANQYTLYYSLTMTCSGAATSADSGATAAAATVMGTGATPEALEASSAVELDMGTGDRAVGRVDMGDNLICQLEQLDQAQALRGHIEAVCGYTTGAASALVLLRMLHQALPPKRLQQLLPAPAKPVDSADRHSHSEKSAASNIPSHVSPFDDEDSDDMHAFIYDQDSLMDIDEADEGVPWPNPSALAGNEAQQHMDAMIMRREMSLLSALTAEDEMMPALGRPPGASSASAAAAATATTSTSGSSASSRGVGARRMHEALAQRMERRMGQHMERMEKLHHERSVSSGTGANASLPQQRRERLSNRAPHPSAASPRDAPPPLSSPPDSNVWQGVESLMQSQLQAREAQLDAQLDAVPGRPGERNSWLPAPQRLAQPRRPAQGQAVDVQVSAQPQMEVGNIAPDLSPRSLLAAAPAAAQAEAPAAAQAKAPAAAPAATGAQPTGDGSREANSSGAGRAPGTAATASAGSGVRLDAAAVAAAFGSINSTAPQGSSAGADAPGDSGNSGNGGSGGRGRSGGSGGSGNGDSDNSGAGRNSVRSAELQALMSRSQGGKGQGAPSSRPVPNRVARAGGKGNKGGSSLPGVSHRISNIRAASSRGSGAAISERNIRIGQRVMRGLDWRRGGRYCSDEYDTGPSSVAAAAIRQAMGLGAQFGSESANSSGAGGDHGVGKVLGWTKQNGEDRGEGADGHKGWAAVRWERTGRRGRYRIGCQDAFELVSAHNL
jgi:hypothetical protein